MSFTSSNPIITHNGMAAEVILASKGPNHKPIFTMRARYPRIIHAEAKTHRVMLVDGVVVEDLRPCFDIMSDPDLSRNGRSSRAVPIKTMIEEIRNAPFVPWHWGKNQRGMQAGADHNEPVILQEYPNYFDFDTPVSREQAWLIARDRALEIAEALDAAGYHKQIVNRLLEPFMWIDVLITSTEWNNFFWLRDHGDAEPHLQDLARIMIQAMDGATVNDLAVGEWHLPYITEADRDEARLRFGSDTEAARQFLCQISSARCARISYVPFDGDASYEREIDRYRMLTGSDRIHASPLEHQAQVDTPVLCSTDIFFEEEGDLTPDLILDARRGFLKEELHGNLDGYIQYRKLVPGENHA